MNYEQAKSSVEELALGVMMNYNEANSVKNLAPEVYEVLKRVDVECLDTTFVNHRGCLTCNGKGKLKWKWQPQVGEWCVDKDGSVALVLSKGVDKKGFTFVWWVDDYTEGGMGDAIPILEWEVIEGVLRKAEYKLILSNDSVELYGCSVWCVYQKFCKAIGDGDTRQEAVMQTVIALGKELKC